MWGENEFGDYVLELKEDSKTFFRIEKFKFSTNLRPFFDEKM